LKLVSVPFPVVLPMAIMEKSFFRVIINLRGTFNVIPLLPITYHIGWLDKGVGMPVIFLIQPVFQNIYILIHVGSAGCLILKCIFPRISHLTIIWGV
jgi:hypothetical protein